MDIKLLAQLRAMDETELYSALYTDVLTGIPNRRAFEAVEHTYVALVDLDSLKYINDTADHREGDRYLITLGQDVAATFGINNVYRMSGDEFAVSGSGFAELRRGLVALRKTLPFFSFGIGVDLVAADNGLQFDKKRRELSGERAARGERPWWWESEVISVK